MVNQPTRAYALATSERQQVSSLLRPFFVGLTPSEFAGFLGRLPRIFREAASILSGLLRSLRCRPSGFGSFPSLLCESTRLLGGFSQPFKLLPDRFGNRAELLGGLPVRLACHAPEFCLYARLFGGLPVAVLLFTTSFGSVTLQLYAFAFRFVGVRRFSRTHNHYVSRDCAKTITPSNTHATVVHFGG